VYVHSDHDHSSRLQRPLGRPSSGQTSIEAKATLLSGHARRSRSAAATQHWKVRPSTGRHSESSQPPPIESAPPIGRNRRPRMTLSSGMAPEGPVAIEHQRAFRAAHCDPGARHCGGRRVLCTLWLSDRGDSPRDILVVELAPFSGEPDISMPIFATVRRKGGGTVGSATLHNGLEPALLLLRRGSYVVSVLGCKRTAHLTTTGVNVVAISFSGHIGKRDTSCSVRQYE
jgi:hypothetical protein